MPDKGVKTVQDQIFYQYAKIVACSAFGLSDGREGVNHSPSPAQSLSNVMM